MLADEDAYYLRRDGFVLPVYRIILNDAERSRIYLDPNTGALLQRVGASDRRYRWLFGALHRLDFAPLSACGQPGTSLCLPYCLAARASQSPASLSRSDASERTCAPCFAQPKSR
jgi:hypothetical protein